ncbi:GntR family transcriptional regulator [Rothia nasimurium]|uniref:GntR family transcriptional regulator n=1 Tax=Rothia nasimurium TaxID=85336 RepID=UPI001F3E7A93|nr:GntR family transcriptional regulator [Rothia nasimurium]
MAHALFEIVTTTLETVNPETTTIDLAPSLAEIARTRPSHAQTTDWAADTLRTAMDAGALTPGSKLTEEHLAGTLGVSRNTLRAAFTLLEAQNLVERIPNRGVFVAKPGPEQVADLFIERWAIQAAALDIAPAGPIPQAHRALARAQEARVRGSVTGMASANQDFHRALVDHAGSARLTQAMSRILAEMRLLFFSQVTVPGFHAPYVERNAHLLALIESGQKEAARAYLREYLVESRNYFTQGF